MERHQDLNTSARFLFIATSRALALYVDLFCSIYISCTAFGLVSFGKVVSSNVGFVITAMTSLIGIFQWGVRQIGEIQTNMTAVERILEYSSLEEEPMINSTSDNQPPDVWPSGGKIEFRNVSLKYMPHLPSSLKNLNFTIMPREKIGIVGRTGAGKSSLTAAIFRLGQVEGKITIDGISTDTLSLKGLRYMLVILFVKGKKLFEL